MSWWSAPPCWRRCSGGELDELHLPARPLDVLAQQIIAEAACREWREDDLYQLVCRADPYRDLDRETFNRPCRMLADGFNTQRGRRSAHLSTGTRSTAACGAGAGRA